MSRGVCQVILKKFLHGTREANARSGQLAARLHPCGLVRRFGGCSFGGVGLDECQQGIQPALDFAFSFRQLNYLVAV